jgi:hypothetical protein
VIIVSRGWEQGNFLPEHFHIWKGSLAELQDFLNGVEHGANIYMSISKLVEERDFLEFSCMETAMKEAGVSDEMIRKVSLLDIPRVYKKTTGRTKYRPQDDAKQPRLF